MTGQPMTIDDVIKEFGSSEYGVPRASMQWALDNWAAAAPRFLDLLSHYVEAPDRSLQTEFALRVIIHLLAEQAETRAFQDLCRLLHDQEGMEIILGDAITSTLSQFLISTFDGDAAVLHAVIETAGVDEYVRHAAITAAAYLTRIGRIPEADTLAWLRDLPATMQPQEVNDVWHGWVQCVSALGLEELTPEVRRLFDRGLIDTAWFTYADFEADLKLTLDDPDRMAGLAAKKLAPLGSAIDALAELNGHYDPAKSEEDWDTRPAPGRPPAQTQIQTQTQAQWPRGGGDRNPWRNIGRNDPCPCGSGKKFKKCCLDTPEAERPVPFAA